MDETRELAKLSEEMEATAKGLVDGVGGYRPFGGFIDEEGKVTLKIDQGSFIGGDYERSLERLLTTLRSDAASITTRAVGVASVYSIKDSSGALSEAIVISMHHREGRCIDFIVRFTRTAAGEVTYYKPQVQIGNLKFF